MILYIRFKERGVREQRTPRPTWPLTSPLPRRAPTKCPAIRTRAVPFSATADDIRNALVGLKTLSYDRGVDGFRLDAINFSIHDLKLTDNPPINDGKKRTRPFDFQDKMPPVLGYFAAVALALYLAVYPAAAAGIAWRFRGREPDGAYALAWGAAWIAKSDPAMPNRPSGVRPGSILSPEKRLATTAPTAMPSATGRSRRLVPSLSSPSVVSPYSLTISTTRAPTK